MKLNEQQLNAVLAEDDKPLLIVAGAGVGKTQVLTSRICHFIQDLGVLSHNILAVTFTKKAALEMKNRLQNMICEANQVKFATIGTFHSVCVKILREFSELIGFRNYFRIIDQDESLKLFTNLCHDHGLHDKNTIRDFYRILDGWRNTGLQPEEIVEKNKNKQTAAQLYFLYRRECHRLQVIDFSDLLLHSVHLLEQFPKVRKTLQERWTHILVDEFQDTNPVQYAFIKHICNTNSSLTVVGDDYQAIHEWRGACVKNILEFERTFVGANVVMLEKNYRSQSYILDAAEAVIQNNVKQRKKQLIATIDKGDPIRVLAFPDEYQEAQWIAQSIRDSVKDIGKQYADIVVLYRTHFHSQVFEKLFCQHGIPYKVYGGLQFFERKEVKDLLSYLHLFLNNESDIDFERVVNVPNRGIGEATIERLKRLSKEENCSLYGATTIAVENCLFKGKVHAGLMQFMTLLRTLSALNSTPRSLLNKCLEKTGYTHFLVEHNQADFEDRLDNVDQLIRICDRYKSVQQLLDDALIVTSSYHTQEHNNNDNRVHLMTVHSSKGLEFPIVYMTGMCEGSFPHVMALKSGAIEEERRLCYVGITRAKENLFLTYPKVREMPFNASKQKMKASRFINEIPVHIMNNAV